MAPAASPRRTAGGSATLLLLGSFLAVSLAPAFIAAQEVVADFNAGPGLTDENGLIGTGPNLARPEQRMLSSMSPAIVSKDGELVAVVGSPGGRTIINTVLQVILNLTPYGMDLPDAVAVPRIHHQWLPDRITAEENGIAPAVVAALEAMGHAVVVRGSQGLAHSILVDPETRLPVGQPDPRNPDAGAAGVR